MDKDLDYRSIEEGLGWGLGIRFEVFSIFVACGCFGRFKGFVR